MRINIKLISFLLTFTVVLSETKASVWEVLLSPRNLIINYLFPKSPNIIRVETLEEARTTNKVTILNFVGLVRKHNYPAEEHHVTTEDGYNLAIHRIPGSPLSPRQKRKEVVLLVPGMFCTSDCWVLFGPDRDLAFLLADQGYDIWIANYRGNSYCRSHVRLSPENSSFWQFSYHEIGTKDLPVIIDYVLDYTKYKALRFIGHSMGTTTLFVLLSMKPEYNAKIKLGICLAPVAYWEKPPPVVIPILDQVSKIKKFLEINEIYELFPLSSKSIITTRTLCADNTITQAACAAAIFLFAGFDPIQLNMTALPEILSYCPAGVSMKILLHYYQNIRTHIFQSYDNKYFGDYEKHKYDNIPIKYDLKNVTAPLALFYGFNDLLALKPNVLRTSKHLPNVILLEENSYKYFNHFDFLWAIDAKSIIYDRVIQVIQQFDLKRGPYLFPTT